MIKGLNTIVQALLGSLFTWGMTAAGAAAVFFCATKNDKLLDVSLGFASGVMTAASFWSLLSPAIEFAEEKLDRWAIAPVAGGFLLGALFVYLADRLLPLLGFGKTRMLDAIEVTFHPEGRPPATSDVRPRTESTESAIVENGPDKTTLNDVNHEHIVFESVPESESQSQDKKASNPLSWRRIVLLIVAITVHNIPEGLAVGVAFGAIGKTKSATFESAFQLALGIGIQNFPEGLAVSLPLAGFGYSKCKAFLYGQFSGMVEPLAALLGAALVTAMEPVLPYALAFAAGAMIFVVVDDIVPEAQVHGNGKLASWGSIVGFIIMMALDVSLG